MIAFCITCRGRVHHLKETLPRNVADNPTSTFVVLDYNSGDGISKYMEQWHLLAPGCPVVYYKFHAATTFHMAHAKNMAHRCGMLEGADIIVNLDADNFTGKGFAKYLHEQFQLNGRDSFMWSRMVPGVLRRGISGRIAVTRDQFLKVGGYDEKYQTYSPDDKDFNRRLCNLGCRPVEIDSQYLNAIHHGAKLRFKEYPHAESKVAEYEKEMLETSSATIVNYGRIGCGTVYRNFQEPITLDPIPTRIFGIGFQKTATTSLCSALTILGHDAAHWISPRWARDIWEEMQLGRSRTFERHYALSDFPIAVLYKELDKAYPGSKFILTVRDEGDWLRSVRNHWDHDRNPYRASWEHDAFSHRMHKIVYGRKSFDAEVFLARYRRHNDDVREYFRSRPGDLLELDIDGGNEWENLCAFLKCPVPSCEYPHEFPTRG